MNGENSTPPINFLNFLGYQTFVVLLAFVTIMLNLLLSAFLSNEELIDFFGNFFVSWFSTFMTMILLAFWLLGDYKILKKKFFKNTTKDKPFLFLISWVIGGIVETSVLTFGYAFGMIESLYIPTESDFYSMTSIFVLVVSYIISMTIMFILFKYMVFNDNFSIKIKTVDE